MYEDLQDIQIKKRENTDNEKKMRTAIVQLFKKQKKISKSTFFFLFSTARLKKVEHSVPEIQVIFYHSHKSNCHCIYE